MTVTGERAGVCVEGGECDTSSFGSGKNWVTKVSGLPLYMRAVAHALVRGGASEQQAIATAVNTMKRWAAGGGDVQPETRQRAQQALNEWNAKRKSADSRGMRDMPGVAVTEGSSAGLLLPKGSPEKTVESIVKTETKDRDKESEPHAFRGKDLDHCTVCQRSARDPIHLQLPDRGERHAGPIGHTHVSGGHALAHYRRRREAAKESFNADCDVLEPKIEAAMRQIFASQEDGALSRLRGKRSRQALRKAASDQTEHEYQEGKRAQPVNKQGPTNPPQPTPAPALAATLPGVPAAAAAPVGAVGLSLASFPPAIAASAVALANAIFTVPFWTAATAAALGVIYKLAEQMAIARVDRDIASSATKAVAAKSQEQTTTVSTTAAKAEDIIAEQTSASAAEANLETSPPTASEVLRQRAQDVASFITDTTYELIAYQLATGLELGESMQQLAKRVQAIFAVSDSRAQRIARSEAMGALNAAANAQAEWLGPEHVARKEWLSLHDDRVRDTHRLADGQVVPLGQPFFVGQTLMQHPGDPTAPASETANCRCSCAFMPPGAERLPR